MSMLLSIPDGFPNDTRKQQKSISFFNVAGFCESAKESIENTLRDKKDVQVLCDALYYQIDVILTGDKDFLEAKLDKPLIYSPGMMFDYLSSE